MALTGSLAVSKDLPGAAISDTAVTAALVKDVFLQGQKIRALVINNTATAAVEYFQIFNAQNPALGTDYAEMCIMAPASGHVVVVVTGDPANFPVAFTYAATDAPHGSSVTGNTKKMFVVAENSNAG